MKKRILSLTLALGLVLGLTACDPEDGQLSASAPAQTAAPSPSATATPAPTATPDPTPEPTPEPTPPSRQSTEYTITRHEHGKSADGMDCFFDLVELTGGASEDAAINALIAQNYQTYQGLNDGGDNAFIGKDSVEAEVTHNADGIFSIRYGISYYTNYDYYGYTYDLRTGRQLSLIDLVPMGETELLQAAKARLYLGLFDVISADMAYEAEGTINDYTLDNFNFCVDEEGQVVFCIPKYELSMGADGSLLVDSGFYIQSAPAAGAGTVTISPGDWSSMETVDGEIRIYNMNLGEDGAFSWSMGIWESEIVQVVSGTYALEGDRLNFHVTEIWSWDDGTATDFTLSYQVTASGNSMTFVQTSTQGYSYNDQVGRTFCWNASTAP